MNRIYCDYNATSPLAESVKQFLAQGDFHFANPASIHSSGKSARYEISKISKFIKDYFNTNKDLFYHSGATEGANTILRSNGHLFYFSSDHPCVTELAKDTDSTALKIEANGSINTSKVIEKINCISGDKILNFTWVHNETGIVWDLNDALEIKRQTGCKVHVDAAQVVGKIEDYQLNDELDFYTFSGHKFGAMKSIGFSFYSEAPQPLLKGGGQQGGLRSGTENVLAIKSLKLALENIDELFGPKLVEMKTQIENKLKDLCGEDIIILGEDCKRNFNTINFIYKKEKADILLAAFDLNGLEVGTGSACSSASAKRSQTLIDMGYSELANHGIRISLSNYCVVDKIVEKLELIFTNL